MKQKTIVKLVTLILLIAFCSCEKDFENEPLPQNKVSIKEYSIETAKKIPRFNNANSKTVNGLNKSRRAHKSEAIAITVDSTTSVKEISIGENYTTYTMLIEDKDLTDASFKNIVIEVRPDSTTVYVVKYTPTEQMEYNEAHDAYSFRGASEVYPTLVIRGPEWDPGTGGYEDPGTGGGASGVTCIAVYYCNRTLTGGVGPEHLAGLNCTHAYSRIECTDWSTGGSGTGGGYHGGSGGTNGSTPINNGPVTSPVIPRPPDEKKCTLFNKLKSDVSFKGLVNEVLKPATNSNPEVGYALTNLPDGTYSAIQGTSNPDLNYAVEFAVPNGTTIDILTHTHYTGGLSIFSPDDLLQMYNVFMNHYDSVDSGQTFTSILVSPTNEVYAMTITDRVQFIAFYNAYLSPAKFDLFNAMYSVKANNNAIRGFSGYEINTLNTPLQNEINFLKLLEKNSGLKLHKANADLSQWNPLKLNSAGTVELQPSCN